MSSMGLGRGLSDYYYIDNKASPKITYINSYRSSARGRMNPLLREFGTCFRNHHRNSQLFAYVRTPFLKPQGRARLILIVLVTYMKNKFPTEMYYGKTGIKSTCRGSSPPAGDLVHLPGIKSTCRGSSPPARNLVHLPGI